MKRAIILSVSLAALVVLASPALVGSGIQSATTQTLLELVPDQANRVLDIRQTGFEQGWFSSSAQIRVSMNELDALVSEPVSLDLNLRIKHGPLLFTREGLRLGLASADIDPVFNGLSAAEIEPEGQIQSDDLYLNLFTAFDSTVTLAMALDNFQASNPEARISIAGLSGSGKILPDASSQTSMELGTLDFILESGVFDLSLHNVSLVGSESDVTRPVSTGESRFAIAQLNTSAPLPLRADSLSAVYRLTEEPGSEGYLTLSQQFGIGALDWDLPVTSLEWQFRLDHLSRKLLESYAQLIEEARRANTGSQTQTAEQLNRLGLDLLENTLRDSFSFDNAIRLDAFDGDHQLQINIHWPGLPNLTSIESLNIQDALEVVDITLILDADQAALMNSPFAQTVIDYERPGFLVVASGRVTSTIRLSDGELDINGEILPLEQFVNLR